MCARSHTNYHQLPPTAPHTQSLIHSTKAAWPRCDPTWPLFVLYRRLPLLNLPDRSTQQAPRHKSSLKRTKCQWSATWKCMKGLPQWIPQLNSDREPELHRSPRLTSLMKCVLRRYPFSGAKVKPADEVVENGMKCEASDGISHGTTPETFHLRAAKEILLLWCRTPPPCRCLTSRWVHLSLLKTLKQPGNFPRGPGGA